MFMCIAYKGNFRNDLYCVGCTWWDVISYSLTHSLLGAIEK